MIDAKGVNISQFTSTKIAQSGSRAEEEHKRTPISE
jgi:hypothetical protein